MAAPLSKGDEGIEIVITGEPCCWPRRVPGAEQTCWLALGIPAARSLPPTDELVSQPYVDMTIKLMERFG